MANDDPLWFITNRTAAQPIAVASAAPEGDAERPMFGPGGWLIGDGLDALVLDPSCTSLCNGQSGGLFGGNGGDGAFGGVGGSAWMSGNGGSGGDGVDAVYDADTGLLITAAIAGGGQWW